MKHTQIGPAMNTGTSEYKNWISSLNAEQRKELDGAFIRDAPQMMSEGGRESIRPDDVMHCIEGLIDAAATLHAMVAKP